MASRAASLLRSSRLQASVRSVLSMRSAQKISSACTSQQIRFQSGEASSELVEILKKELAGEQSSAAEAPAVPAGWSMKDTSGCQFTLEKKAGSLTIEVQVDVNNVEEVDTSRFDENPDEADQLPQEGEGPQYLPHFSVTVANSQAGQNVRFYCSFEEGAERDMIFTLTEMCLFKPGMEREVDERNVYHCNASALDADMYEGILKFIESTGVDPAFLEYLISQTQSYEQSKYMGFLEGAAHVFKC